MRVKALDSGNLDSLVGFSILAVGMGEADFVLVSQSPFLLFAFHSATLPRLLFLLRLRFLTVHTVQAVPIL